MNSLERTLQLWLVGSIVILMFIFWWGTTLTSRMMTESYLFTQLEQQAHDIHAVMVNTPSDVDAYIDELTRRNPQHNYLVIRDINRIRTSSSIAHGLAGLPELVPGQSLRKSLRGTAGQPLLGWFGGFGENDGEFMLGVLQDVSIIKDKLMVFQWFAAIFVALLLAAVLAIQHYILHRYVANLEGVRRDMMRLEHGQAVALSEEVPSEIMPLVTEFNQLLRRFDQRLRQSRNAVGNLAHSLKGPLNLLIRSTQAEIISDKEKHAVAQNAEHIRKLIDSELKRARLAGRGAVGIHFDVNTELPSMIALLEQVYPEKGVAILYTVDKDVKLVHDRQDMLELIGNLLDNAVKWCDQQVVLTIRSADGVVIDVEDDGPGCSPEVLGRLTGRGVRLDESVAGHGLGLSIVKDIVDTYDGRLLLEHSIALGGLKVSAYLPQRR